MLLRTNEIVKRYKLSRHTLLNYEKTGILKTYKTPGGHRRFLESDIKKLLGLK